MRTVSGGVAKRYANAVFQAAVKVKGKAVDDVEQDLLALRVVLTGEPKLVEFLSQPLIPYHRKEQFLQRTLKGRLNELSLRFLSLLVRRRRLTAFDHIVTIYQDLANEWRNIVTADVTSAVELTPQEQEMIAGRLGEMTNKQILLHTRIDPGIVGGLVIKVGDKLLDMSLRSHLERIRERLKQARVTKLLSTSAAPALRDGNASVQPETESKEGK